MPASRRKIGGDVAVENVSTLSHQARRRKIGGDVAVENVSTPSELRGSEFAAC
jgi:hypothetical protein